MAGSITIYLKTNFKPTFLHAIEVSVVQGQVIDIAEVVANARAKKTEEAKAKSAAIAEAAVARALAKAAAKAAPKTSAKAKAMAKAAAADENQEPVILNMRETLKASNKEREKERKQMNKDILDARNKQVDDYYEKHPEAFRSEMGHIAAMKQEQVVQGAKTLQQIHGGVLGLKGVTSSSCANQVRNRNENDELNRLYPPGGKRNDGAASSSGGMIKEVESDAEEEDSAAEENGSADEEEDSAAEEVDVNVGVLGKQPGGSELQISAASSSEEIQIFVKPLTGPTIPVDVRSDDTIDVVKDKFINHLDWLLRGFDVDDFLEKDKELWISGRFQLVFGSKQLDDSATLAQCRIQKGSMVKVVYGLDGGGKRPGGLQRDRAPSVGAAVGVRPDDHPIVARAFNMAFPDNLLEYLLVLNEDRREAIDKAVLDQKTYERIIKILIAELAITGELEVGFPKE